MARTNNELADDMERFEERIETADKAIVQMLKLSNVHPEVILAIGALIELRSEAAENLSRTIDEFNDTFEEVIILEVVEYGIPA